VSRFLDDLGVSHQDIINHCNGTLKLGIIFEGFHSDNPSFTFPFGYSNNVVTPEYNTASVDLMMRTKKISKNIFKYPDISTHFRATDILSYMDTLVGQFKNLTIKRNTVTLDEIEGTYDLLLDCTGFKRLMSHMPDNFVSIEDKMPNNQAFVYRFPYSNKEEQMMPYTLVKAMDYGWAWHIPLRDQLAIGYVHDRKYDVKDEFIKHVESKAGITVDPAKIGTIHMVTGRNKVHLNDKIVAVGLASAFIEPLESTGLYLTTSALEKIQEYINGNMSAEEYNKEINRTVDVIIDFIIAHYKYSDKSNEYWDHFKKLEIEHYGQLEIFPNTSWDYILSGFLKDVARPVEQIDSKEMIEIGKGRPYAEWIQDDSNFE